ncbi:MAG: disulfide bond formation protein DsbA [Rickettsiales bacterium]|nr:disulfide bond formation protein DsbA [Rickettsiales bacterium]
MSEEGPLLECFFDFSSPFAYLGATQAQALADRAGAELRWRPMLLGGVFRAIDTEMVPLKSFAAVKQRYVALELKRWAEHWGVPFQFASRFPMNTVKSQRIVCQLDPGQQGAFVQRTFAAFWAEDRDISDDGVLEQILAELDLPTRLLAGTREQSVKDKLRASTEEAVARGVFGAPTWFVNGDLMFWGQDRLDFVERALAGWTPACG